ncbi:nucleotidyltransferase family protein [Eubacterium limosum]|uniref:Nucleotidyltransferase family protein n=1 Tax=Eubacterium limosum TaxID=1736 RepID=A0ABT5UX18_EUBLI|nr:nucleotidyltransferase family protein [Eubacterium limosum]MCB6571555.1 nucleotidyltransferase family protein [Eubacterium limosum]MDE1472520.1 nucleotidyltransferase family protein [Eubacterium limosum]
MKENTVEMQYLYELAASVLEVRPPARPPSKLNWELVCREADRLYMLSFICYGLEGLYENNQPSNSVMSELKKWKIKGILKEAEQQRLLTKVFCGFDAQNLKCLLCSDLPLKHLYPYPDLRYRQKVEVFMPAEAISCAGRILRDLGGSPLAAESPDFGCCRFGQTILTVKKYSDEASFPSPDKKIQKYKHYSNIYEPPPEALYRQLAGSAAQAARGQKEFIWPYFDLSMLQRFYHFSLPAKYNAFQVNLKSLFSHQGQRPLNIDKTIIHER